MSPSLSFIADDDVAADKEDNVAAVVVGAVTVAEGCAAADECTEKKIVKNEMWRSIYESNAYIT